MYYKREDPEYYEKLWNNRKITRQTQNPIAFKLCSHHPNHGRYEIERPTQCLDPDYLYANIIEYKSKNGDVGCGLEYAFTDFRNCVKCHLGQIENLYYVHQQCPMCALKRCELCQTPLNLFGPSKDESTFCPKCKKNESNCLKRCVKSINYIKIKNYLIIFSMFLLGILALVCYIIVCFLIVPFYSFWRVVQKTFKKCGPKFQSILAKIFIAPLIYLVLLSCAIVIYVVGFLYWFIKFWVEFTCCFMSGVMPSE